jgi:gamma-glutamylcyclotransferase (GGCT)/AIG2-like uncharacterized protein YtfP
VKLFVYGTLKYPEIVTALTGKSILLTDAILVNYKVIGLKNKPYPGLIQYDGSIAEGKLLILEEESFSIIKKWEDVEYIIQNISVIVENTNTEAVTFLHIEKSEQLPILWDEINFKKNYLDDYIQNRIPDYLNK